MEDDLRSADINFPRTTVWESNVLSCLPKLDY